MSKPKIVPDAEDGYLLRPDPADPKLSVKVSGVDETGKAVDTSVVVERPLTIFLNRQEIVTAMTIGDYPEYLAVGFLLNQNMLRPDDMVTEVEYDDDLEVIVVRTERATNYEKKLKKKVQTSGCAQGTVFGDLMEALEDVKLPDAELRTVLGEWWPKRFAQLVQCFVPLRQFAHCQDAFFRADVAGDPVTIGEALQSPRQLQDHLRGDLLAQAVLDQLQSVKLDVGQPPRLGPVGIQRVGEGAGVEQSGGGVVGGAVCQFALVRQRFADVFGQDQPGGPAAEVDRGGVDAIAHVDRSRGVVVRRREEQLFAR